MRGGGMESFVVLKRFELGEEEGKRIERDVRRRKRERGKNRFGGRPGGG
jgi:hypothetical protein